MYPFPAGIIGTDTIRLNVLDFVCGTPSVTDSVNAVAASTKAGSVAPLMRPVALSNVSPGAVIVISGVSV